MTLRPSDLGATTQNWIGRSQYSDPYLNGRVDDFRLYAGALSATEIAALAAPIQTTGLGAHRRLRADRPHVECHHGGHELTPSAAP